MAGLLTVSQTSLLLFPQVRLQNSSRWQQSVACSEASQFATSTMHVLTTRRLFSPLICSQQMQLSSWEVRAGVTSDTRVPTTFMVNSGGKTNDILPDSGGSGDNFGAAGGNGGGGGNNGGNGNNNEGKGDPDDSESGHVDLPVKLTLAYAVLFGVSGVLGYLRSGSQKSLIAGGLSAAILYYVYTLLPTRPVFGYSILGVYLIVGSFLSKN